MLVARVIEQHAPRATAVRLPLVIALCVAATTCLIVRPIPSSAVVALAAFGALVGVTAVPQIRPLSFAGVIALTFASGPIGESFGVSPDSSWQSILVAGASAVLGYTTGSFFRHRRRLRLPDA